MLQNYKNKNSIGSKDICIAIVMFKKELDF
jgi:hypothetical protein